ncbi:hypothetical protein [Streptacidiphilus jiangxiensis]|uniref:Calcium-binding protein n=1 Tax=Streptacidiphilus jiangxiensis TaxID=235985 RepID=A0A1H7MEI3_STRJI|nr:hypothetical protein [Streptacidiphilus jiangxiensis]SEL09017.1 hypothetical protein SAMN05414137_105311 [Streptacidiphilus jiangxiensis]
MRIRIAAPAVVGALALAAVAAPGTAFAASSPVVKVSASAASFTIGLTNPYTFQVTVSASTLKGIKSIKAEPWTAAGNPAFHGPNAAAVAQESLDLKTLRRTATSLTVGYTEHDSSATNRPPNAIAGTWELAVLVTTKDGRTVFEPRAAHFTVKRADVLSAKPSAATVRKGAALTVKGQLNRADWNKGVWAGNGGQWVQVQFRKAGTSTWVTVAVAKTAANGSVSASVRDYASGSWRLAYNGNAVSSAAVSGAAGVTVK